MKDTPIFICSKDRLSFLRTLLATLLAQGYGNLFIVDTGSKYPPMVKFLEQCEFSIIKVGTSKDPHLSLWTFNVLDFVKHDGFFVYTDCDVVPDVGCPDDWLLRLKNLLDKYPQFPKAGLGLRIDDLPDYFTRKQEVIDWESRFSQRALEPDVFDAEIDTTLALYRPGVVGNTPAIRTGGSYVARHLPWYSDSNNPSEEERWYKAHMAQNVGHWR